MLLLVADPTKAVRRSRQAFPQMVHYHTQDQHPFQPGQPGERQDSAISAGSPSRCSDEARSGVHLPEHVWEGQLTASRPILGKGGASIRAAARSGDRTSSQMLTMRRTSSRQWLGSNAAGLRRQCVEKTPVCATSRHRRPANVLRREEPQCRGTTPDHQRARGAGEVRECHAWPQAAQRPPTARPMRRSYADYREVDELSKA